MSKSLMHFVLTVNKRKQPMLISITVHLFVKPVQLNINKSFCQIAILKILVRFGTHINYKLLSLEEEIKPF